MAGRTLHTQTLQTSLEKLDISAYTTGSYIIQLTDKNGGRIVKKIVKE
jgi:phosphoribosyl-ATP pyrophosphohydrolase